MNPPANDGYGVQDELLDSEITEDEVTQAIRKLKTGKAADADQLITEFLKSAELVETCNVIFNSGISPERWTKSNIVPLYKKGDCENSYNYRGLSLLSSMRFFFLPRY